MPSASYLLAAAPARSPIRSVKFSTSSERLWWDSNLALPFLAPARSVRAGVLFLCNSSAANDIGAAPVHLAADGNPIIRRNNDGANLLIAAQARYQCGACRA